MTLLELFILYLLWKYRGYFISFKDDPVEEYLKPYAGLDYQEKIK